MRIYIRHAEKKYINGQSDTYCHDPDITEDGIIRARRTSLKLVKAYGIPKMIICSPYLRTRHTAEQMKLMLSETHKADVEIRVDVNISEYLGNHADKSLDVHPETLDYHPPHPENIHGLHHRVRLHNDDMISLDDTREVYWFVTHGIVINQIANILGYTNRRKIYNLGIMVVQKNHNGSYFCKFLFYDEGVGKRFGRNRRVRSNVQAELRRDLQVVDAI